MVSVQQLKGLADMEENGYEVRNQRNGVVHIWHTSKG